MGDDSWRSLPKIIADDTTALISRQLADLYAAQKRPFSIVLHGGEPLLLGRHRLSALVTRLRSALGRECSISVQTNGILISNELLDLFAENGIRVSVSIDGPSAVHDRSRVDKRNRGSHSRVMAGLEILKAHAHSRELFSGILAVVDPESSPVAVFDFFKKLQVPSVDFLYRDGNHSNLPPGKGSIRSIEFGRWLGEILDLYIADAAPFRIRVLDDMMRLLLGGAGVKEGVGLTDYGILIIDTDGAIKKNDTLKSTPLRDTFSNQWHVRTHSLADIAVSEEFLEYHRAQRPTASQCLSCPFLKICGGGMLAHRFKDGNGYDNPTVFCADQTHLIQRMAEHLRRYSADRTNAA